MIDPLKTNNTNENAARNDENIIYALLLALLSYFAVATMGVFAKLVQTQVNLSAILFAQYIVGFIIVSCIVMRQPAGFLKTGKPWVHLVRISAGIILIILAALVILQQQRKREA